MRRSDPFNYCGYAYGEEVVSCTADVSYILEDNMYLLRNSSVVASNSNYSESANENDIITYGCVNSYHTWQATVSIAAYSVENGWSDYNLGSLHQLHLLLIRGSWAPPIDPGLFGEICSKKTRPSQELDARTLKNNGR